MLYIGEERLMAHITSATKQEFPSAHFWLNGAMASASVVTWLFVVLFHMTKKEGPKIWAEKYWLKCNTCPSGMNKDHRV